MQILDFVIRLSSASLLGTLVGLERQRRQRMAGTCTSALVAARASVFVMCLSWSETIRVARPKSSRTWSPGSVFWGLGSSLRTGAVFEG